MCLAETMPAVEAIDLGLASSVVSSIDELDAKVQGLAGRFGRWDKCSLSEALVRHVEQCVSRHDNSSKLAPIQWLDAKLAHIQLTTAVDLRYHLTELAESGMSGLIIEDCGLSAHHDTNFLADVREMLERC